MDIYGNVVKDSIYERIIALLLIVLIGEPICLDKIMYRKKGVVSFATCYQQR